MKGGKCQLKHSLSETNNHQATFKLAASTRHENDDVRIVLSGGATMPDQNIAQI